MAASFTGIYGSVVGPTSSFTISVNIRPFSGPSGTHHLPQKQLSVHPGTTFRSVFRRYQPRRRLDGSLRFFWSPVHPDSLGTQTPSNPNTTLQSLSGRTVVEKSGTLTHITDMHITAANFSSKLVVHVPKGVDPVSHIRPFASIYPPP